LYGAPLGIVTALANGVGAIADSVMETKTGKDMKGTIIADLFGDDKDAAGDSTVQVASAQTGATAQAAAATTTTGPTAQQTQSFALNGKTTNKLPYGGVMAPVQSTQQQNMAMAMAAATSGKSTRIGNTLYTNRFLNGPRPAPASTTRMTASATPPSAASVAANLQSLPGTFPATAVPSGMKPVLSTGTMTPVTIPVASADTATTSVATTAAVASTASAAPVDRTIPKELSDDALIMKALGLYQSVGARSGTPATATIN
jgi:hypothetical protein